MTTLQPSTFTYYGLCLSVWTQERQRNRQRSYRKAIVVVGVIFRLAAGWALSYVKSSIRTVSKFQIERCCSTVRQVEILVFRTCSLSYSVWPVWRCGVKRQWDEQDPWPMVGILSSPQHRLVERVATYPLILSRAEDTGMCHRSYRRRRDRCLLLFIAGRLFLLSVRASRIYSQSTSQFSYERRSEHRVYEHPAVYKKT